MAASWFELSRGGEVDAHPAMLSRSGANRDDASVLLMSSFVLRFRSAPWAV